MSGLIYYKIDTPKGTKEGNWLINSKKDNPTYEELQNFFRVMRESYNTTSRPIIINIMKVIK